jgi:hypothetical protein
MNLGTLITQLTAIGLERGYEIPVVGWMLTGPDEAIKSLDTLAVTNAKVGIKDGKPVATLHLESK